MTSSWKIFPFFFFSTSSLNWHAFVMSSIWGIEESDSNKENPCYIIWHLKRNSSIFKTLVFMCRLKNKGMNMGYLYGPEWGANYNSWHLINICRIETEITPTESFQCGLFSKHLQFCILTLWGSWGGFPPLVRGSGMTPGGVEVRGGGACPSLVITPRLVRVPHWWWICFGYITIKWSIFYSYEMYTLFSKMIKYGRIKCIQSWRFPWMAAVMYHKCTGEVDLI